MPLQSPGEEAAASFVRHYPGATLGWPPRATVWRGRGQRIQATQEVRTDKWEESTGRPGDRQGVLVPMCAGWREPAGCRQVCALAALVGRMLVWVMEVLENSNSRSCLGSQISHLMGCWKALCQSEKPGERPQ